MSHISREHVAVVLVREESHAARIAKVLTQGGIKSILCRNPDELYATLNSQCVDALIVQNDLPGFFRGVELVDRLRQELLEPATLLLTHPSREIKDRANALGIRALLSPDESAEKIGDVVQGLLASAAQIGIPIPMPARRLVAETNVIQPLPQLLVKLASYLHDDSVSLSQLAAEISTDPRVTADLLRVTNSSGLGSRTRITRVVDAVSHLGIRRTVSLAFSSAVRSSQAGVLRPLPAQLQSWFQFRSLLLANVAGAFASKISPAISETAYVMGLMQDLGILLMLSSLGSRYQKLLWRVISVGQLSLPTLESQEFGYTHADVSAALLHKWRLPQTMVRITARHHDTIAEGQFSKIEEGLLAAVQIADAFVDLRDVPCPQRHERLAKALAGFGGTLSEGTRDCFAQAISRTLHSAEIFSTAIPPGFEPTRMTSLIDGSDLSNEDGGNDYPPSGIESPRLLLVIDDDPHVTTIVERLLKRLPIDVTGTTSLKNALKLTESADVILCDVHFPEGNGIDFVRQIRSRGFTHPILMISNDRTRDTVLRALEAGVDDFIPKPISQDRLVAKLARHGVIPGGPVASIA